MVVHGRPKTRKNRSFLGSSSPQGSQSPYILEDTTRPGRVTCVLVWSKSDRRLLRKTLHKQTDKQTDRQTNRHYENNGHLAVNQLSHHITSLLNSLHWLKINESVEHRWHTKFWLRYSTQERNNFACSCVLQYGVVASDESLQIVT